MSNNSWIVVLKEDIFSLDKNNKNIGVATKSSVQNVAQNLVNQVLEQQNLSTSSSAGNAVKLIYESTIKGFSATLSENVANALSLKSEVDYILPDDVVNINFNQENPPWGLDRLDQENLPLDAKFSYHAKGSDLHAYIIDTGIYSNHNEFLNRVSNGYDFVNMDNNPEDCNGHGTHVAGIIGGTTYGVAKNITLHAVKALDCNGSGYFSWVIAAVDWITSNHISPAIVNLSLGGSGYTPLDEAIKRSSASNNIAYVVAAGNSNADACNYSPAREQSAITVASTTESDFRSSFSNFGNCLDIFAPGSNIKSAWIQNPSDNKVSSGTSMAAPHVAGAIALACNSIDCTSPHDAFSWLLNRALVDKIQSAGANSPNLLVHLNTAPAPFDIKGGFPNSGYSVNANDYNYKTGDFNGDGKTDLIHFVNNAYTHVWLSNGDGTFDIKGGFPNSGYSVNANDYNYKTGDFNGDGKTDLIHFVNADYVHVWLSNGDM